MSRLNSAFRPSTQVAYSAMFRTLVAFCVYMCISWSQINVGTLLAFLECLNVNGVSSSMQSNYLAALRANFIIHGLPSVFFDDKKLHYYVKSLRINPPLCISRCNIIGIQDLYSLVGLCDTIYMGKVFKTVFLLAFFLFFRLSNLCPHSLSSFDFTRHLAAGDTFFDSDTLKALLKWSKTIQSRDKAICPVRALSKMLKMYSARANDPLFQFRYKLGWKVPIDSKVRKTLSLLNVKMGYSPHYFTFHSFRRSGASLAFSSHVPLQQIKMQGTWSSDCVWQYIHSNPDSASQVASTFAKLYPL